MRVEGSRFRVEGSEFRVGQTQFDASFAEPPRRDAAVMNHDVAPKLKPNTYARRRVDIRLHGKGNSKLPWRKAGQPSHLVDVVDSDQ